MLIFLQLLLVGLWGTTLTLHTRRLFRLAAIQAKGDRSRYLRGKAQRMWWWLGRGEFWEGAQQDLLRSIELTLMVILIVLGW